MVPSSVNRALEYIHTMLIKTSIMHVKDASLLCCFFSHARRWCQNYNFIFSRQTSMCTKWPSGCCAVTARTRVVHTERQLNDRCLPCAPITPVPESFAARQSQFSAQFSNDMVWFCLCLSAFSSLCVVVDAHCVRFGDSMLSLMMLLLLFLWLYTRMSHALSVHVDAALTHVTCHVCRP